MKNKYAALAAFMLVTQCLHIISATKENLSYDLDYNLKSVFMSDKVNMFTSRITSSTLAGWNLVMERIKTFVEDNSKNQLGIKDSDLIKPLTIIENANINLLNAIKITYSVNESPSDMNKQIDVFNKIKQAMTTVQGNLKKATFILNKEQKTEAKEILIKTAQAIEKAADKAIKDIRNFRLS